MAKILTDKELLEIVTSIVSGDVLDDQEQYMEFLEDPGAPIGNHCGAEVGLVDQTEDLGYNVAFHITKETPSDGGVFSRYDKDIIWSNGREKDPGNFFALSEVVKVGGGDEARGLYVCRADTPEEAKRLWSRQYCSEEATIEERIADEYSEYYTSAGNTFRLFDLEQISEADFQVLSKHITVLT